MVFSLVWRGLLARHTFGTLLHVRERAVKSLSTPGRHHNSSEEIDEEVALAMEVGNDHARWVHPARLHFGE